MEFQDVVAGRSAPVLLGTVSHASGVRTEDKQIRVWAVEAAGSHFVC